MTPVLVVVGVVMVVAVFLAWASRKDARRARDRLQSLEERDQLTGLPNRVQLDRFLGEILRTQRDQTSRTALVAVELRGVHHLNASYGVEVGDAVVLAAAGALADRLQAGDVLVRWGGPRFVAVCPDVPDPTQARARAEEMVAAVQRPVEVGLDRIRAGASAGVVLSDQRRSSPETLLPELWAALDEALVEGRGAVQLFDEATRGIGAPVTTETRLREALERGEFWLLYLPVLRLTDHRMVGVEALLRWADPQVGLVSPRQFLRALDESGLIVPVGTWVIEEAVRQSRKWQDQFPGVGEFEISVNLSPRQLEQVDLLETVATAIAEHEADPTRLCLEISEGAFDGDVEETWRTLRQIKSIGCRLALDDFGTGSASLSYLRQLKVDELKISSTFVAGLPASLEDAAIVEHVVGLARSLGIRPVAEGVERGEQADALRRLGCELAQGYYFANPQPAAVIGELLAKGARAPDPAGEPQPAGGTPRGTVVSPRLS